MNYVTKMTPEERKKNFELYLKKNEIKSATLYLAALEKGFLEAPVNNYSSIYEITDPDLLEDEKATSKLRTSSKFIRATKGGTAGLAGLNHYIKFLKDSRDSYYDFMNHFEITPKKLFDWGMKATIFPSVEVVEEQWEDLKKRISNNQTVYIRGYGRDAVGTPLFIDFYEYLFNNSNIKKDSSNNSRPQSNIKKMTTLTRNKDIYNYQVSHIWGHTKNVYLFEAPWNICYTPKIIDPFTGHETKGDLPREFQEHFIKYAQRKYKKYIDEYNSIISSIDIKTKLDEYCKLKSINDERFKRDAIEELSPIVIIK